MRILSHYFIARVAGLFATILVAALLLLSAVELVLNLEELTTLSAPSFEVSPDASLDASSTKPGGYEGLAQSSNRHSVAHWSPIRSLWIRLASYYLPELLPIAAFFSVFAALAWAGKSMELIAIHAGGIRTGRIVLPILGFGLILSFACGILHETLILDAHRVWNQRSASEAAKINFDRSAFWYHRGNTITQIRASDPDTRSLLDVEIYERGDDGRVRRVLRSPRVEIAEDGVWTLEPALIWSFDPDVMTAAPRYEEVDRLTLDLANVGGDSLLGAEPSLLSLPALARFLSSGARLSEADARRLKIRLNDRLSRPIIVFLFVLMALPFGLAVDHRGRFAMPALGAILAISSFHFVRSTGTTLAELELFPAGLAPWLSILLFATLALGGLRRV